MIKVEETHAAVAAAMAMTTIRALPSIGPAAAARKIGMMVMLLFLPVAVGVPWQAAEARAPPSTTQRRSQPEPAPSGSDSDGWNDELRSRSIAPGVRSWPQDTRRGSSMSGTSINMTWLFREAGTMTRAGGDGSVAVGGHGEDGVAAVDAINDVVALRRLRPGRTSNKQEKDPNEVDASKPPPVCMTGEFQVLVEVRFESFRDTFVFLADALTGEGLLGLSAGQSRFTVVEGNCLKIEGCFPTTMPLELVIGTTLNKDV
jgi:hypothetical protein